MLKKLTPRHRRIIRDLVTGRDPKDIAKDLDISVETILRLQREDPLFKSEVRTLEIYVEKRLAESEDRISVMEKLDLMAHDAANLCSDIIDGTEKEVPIGLRLQSAWDVLDRTGHKPTEKKIVGIANAADMIIAAYNAKHGEKDKMDADTRAVDV